MMYEPERGKCEWKLAVRCMAPEIRTYVHCISFLECVKEAREKGTRDRGGNQGN